MAANNISSKRLCFCCLLLRDQCFMKLTELLSWGKSLCHVDTLGSAARAFMPPLFFFMFLFSVRLFKHGVFGIRKTLVTEERLHNFLSFSLSAFPSLEKKKKKKHIFRWGGKAWLLCVSCYFVVHKWWRLVRQTLMCLLQRSLFYRFTVVRSFYLRTVRLMGGWVDDWSDETVAGWWMDFEWMDHYVVLLLTRLMVYVPRNGEKGKRRKAQRPRIARGSLCTFVCSAVCIYSIPSHHCMSFYSTGNQTFISHLFLIFTTSNWTRKITNLDSKNEATDDIFLVLQPIFPSFCIWLNE